MSQDYRRFPFLRGNTDIPVVTQPLLRGTVRKDTSTGEITALPLSSELRVESDTGGPTSVVFATSRELSSIVTQLNTALAGTATAEEVDGVLALRSVTAGDGAFVRVHPETGGFTDAAPFFGLRQHPHPEATVASGDVEASNVRSQTQGNPHGTGMLANEDDRLEENTNRLASVLALNGDFLYSALKAPVAQHAVLDVDVSDVAWSPRVVLDADGNVEQLNLSNLVPVDAALAGRVYVGNLANSSTLWDLSQYFQVVDADGNQIPSQFLSIVRVGAVTRGQRVAAMPTFGTEDAAPAGAIGDTATAAPDGGNALGVDLTKEPSAAITEVKDRTAIVCAGATFVTNGVVAGDVAVVSASTISTPYNHNGTYLVDVVVSETELVLRASVPGQKASLNLSGGTLGNVVVSSGGDFQDNVWLSFVPPIPRTVTRNGVDFRVHLGLERSLAELQADTLIKNSIRGAPETDGFMMRGVWQRHTLEGAYDGPWPRSPAVADNGRGAFITQRGRPITIHKRLDAAYAGGTPDRTFAAGEVLANNILVADATDTFTENDLGRVISLVGGTIPTGFRAVIDILYEGGNSAALRRIDTASNTSIPVTAVVGYTIFRDALRQMPASLQVVVPEHHSGTDDTATPGIGYVREKSDVAEVADALIGTLGFFHVEEIAIRGASGAGVNLLGSTGVFAVGTSYVDLSFDPAATYNFHAPLNASLGLIGDKGPMLCRVMHGPEMGWYWVHRIRSVAGASEAADRLVLRTLEGGTPVWTASATYELAFYNVVFGTQVPNTDDGSWAGVRIYTDLEHSAGTTGSALNLAHRGTGASLFIGLNDGSFVADTNGDGAVGNAIRVEAYAPANGLLVGAVGDTGGADSRRAGYAARLKARTHARDLSVSVSVLSQADQAATFWTHQGGTDPSLVVTRSSTDAFPDIQDIHVPGLGIVGNVGDTQLGMGTAVNLWAGIWLHQNVSGGAGNDWEPGFFFAEGLAVVGRTARPALDEDLVSYLGRGAYLGWDAPAALGDPAEVAPGAAFAGALGGPVTPPDYSTFNMDHAGTIYLAAAVTAISGAEELLLGTRVVIESGADAGKNFRIIHFDRGSEIAALAGPADITASYSADYRIYGNRWREIYGSVGDWTQIGTRFARGDPADLPVVTLGRVLNTLDDPLSSASWPASADSDDVGTPDVEDTEGNLGVVPAVPNQEGTGVAEFVPLASMPTVAAIPPGGGTGTEWADDANEPRAPFPNVGTISAGTDGYTATITGHGVPGQKLLTSEKPGSPLWDEVYLYHENGATLTDSAFLGYYSGGNGLGGIFIGLDAPGSAANTETVEVRFRGVRGMCTKHMQLRATAILWWDNYNGTVEFKLRNDSGTEIATSVPLTLDTSGTNVFKEVTYTFTVADFLDKAYDYIDANTFHTEGMHLCVRVTLGDNTATEPTDLHFGRVVMETLTRAKKVLGPMEVAGPVRVASLRRISPVRGYDSISPVRVDLLESTEFADLVGRLASDTTPEHIQEGMGIGHLLAAGPTHFIPLMYRQTFFRKGHHAAAIHGVYPYFDPLFYLFGAAVTPNSYAMCGRTGFIGEILAPHGSRLATAHWSLTLRPAFSYRSGSGAAAQLNFQVWSQGVDPGTGIATAAVKATWDALEGYTVRIHRQHVLDFGRHMPNPGGSGYASRTPDFGYSEEIWSQTVDLSGETEPLYTAGTNGDEFASQGGANLLLDTGHGDFDKLYVDRRHFNYFFTVEFFIGRRDIEDTTTEKYEYRNSAGFLSGATIGAEGGFNTPTLQVHATNPGGNPIVGAGLSAAPIVKFRGMRIGYDTDRVGGGW